MSLITGTAGVSPASSAEGARNPIVAACLEIRLVARLHRGGRRDACGPSFGRRGLVEGVTKGWVIYGASVEVDRTYAIRSTAATNQVPNY